MRHSLAAGAALLLCSLQGARAFYAKSSPVLQVTGKTYDKLIAGSNYTSIVEFYAPWCGHCKNLKPAYEKAAKNLDGLAQVAAVDCDDDANKAFCGSMGVQGFPTLKIVRPGMKPGARPVAEEYQGPRSATGIVDAVTGKINNHVARVAKAGLDGFLAADGGGPKALLFSDKGSASTLLKSLAIEFLGVIPVGLVRSKEAGVVEKFGVTKFPTLVLFPGGGAEAVVYEGPMTKPGMVGFLSQAAAPNSKRVPGSGGGGGGGGKKPSKAAGPGAVEEEFPTKAAEQQMAPVILDIPPIPTLNTEEKLARECLGPKSHMCVLVFLPEGQSARAHKALETLADSAHRHAQGQHHFFPFFAVPRGNPGAASVLGKLELAGDVEIVAVNARRGWWRHYDGDFGTDSVESWIDTIRMGEGTKSRLPDGFGEAAGPEATSDVGGVGRNEKKEGEVENEGRDENEGKDEKTEGEVENEGKDEKKEEDREEKKEDGKEKKEDGEENTGDGEEKTEGTKEEKNGAEKNEDEKQDEHVEL